MYSLNSARDFKLFVAAVLLYIGMRLARDLLAPSAKPHPHNSIQGSQPGDV